MWLVVVWWIRGYPSRELGLGPLTIQEYNTKMGGVDAADHRCLDCNSTIKGLQPLGVLNEATGKPWNISSFKKEIVNK